jgi:hypothetical protein
MENSPGLNRIICIDAHILGRTLEVKLAQHANISGSNGSGKTTLLKLIPFFYGAEPRELVDKVGKKIGFTDYYLGRATSIIVFEYMTPRGLKCVAVYRHSSGLKPAYRFLDQAFSVNCFSEVREGSAYYIEGRNLGRHWAMEKLSHSNQIDVVTDYRAVIQGDKSLINRSGQSRELKPLVAAYSLGGTSSGMAHVNKMTASILSRRKGMEGVKQMIAEIMREDGVQFPPLNLHSDVREAVAELSVLRKFNREKGFFRSVINQGIRYTENQIEMRDCTRTLDAHLRLIKQRRATIESKLELEAVQLNALNDDWDLNDERLARESRTAISARDQAVEVLNQLDDEYQRWLDEDIQLKQSEYDDLEEYEQALEQCRNHQDALEAGVLDLKQHYEGLKQAEVERHLKAKFKNEQTKTGLSTEQSDTKAKWEARKRELDAKLVAERDALRERRKVDEDELAEQVHDARYRANTPTYLETERVELLSAETTRDQLERELEAAELQLKESSISLAAEDEQVNAAKSGLNSAQDQHRLQESRLSKLMALNDAKPGTLLFEARTQHPRWFDTLGRVVREEVLHQRDLNPTFNPNHGDELFGWRIDASKLDKPEHALSEDEIADKIERQEAALSLSADHVSHEEATYERCLTKRQKVQADHDELDRQRGHLQRKYDASKDSLVQVKARIAEADVQRRKSAEEERQMLEARLEELRVTINEEVEKIEELHSDASREASGLFSTELSRIDQELTRVADKIEAEDKKHRQSLRALEKEFTRQSVEKGVDEAALDKAINDTNEAREKCAEVISYREDIRNYEAWFAQEWSRKDAYEVKRSEAEAEVNRLESERNEVQRRFSAQKEANKQRTKVLQQDLKRERDRGESCESMLNRLRRSELQSPDDHEPVEDQIETLEAVLANVESLLTTQIVLMDDIKGGVNRAQSIISQQNSIQIYEAWNELHQQAERNAASSRDPNALWLNLTQSLDQLLTVQLPQKSQTIETYLRVISDQLVAYYSGLKQVTSQIKNQSKRISEAIGETEYFSAIGNIDVKLSSKIDHLDYWQHLGEFEKTYLPWSLEDSGSLPPEGLDDQLIKLTDILHRSQRIESVNAMFDLEISILENGRQVSVNSSADLAEVSSNGLSYLILCSIFAGITRMLCRDHGIRIHWPVDELGVIDSVNVSSLFQMLDDFNIVMVGGFPTTDPLLLQHFTERHELRAEEGLVDIDIPQDKLQQLLERRLDQKSVAKHGK